MSKKRSSVFAKKKSGVTPQNWQLKKGRQVFQEKNRGVTASVAATGVTHPSDAAGDGLVDISTLQLIACTCGTTTTTTTTGRLIYTTHNGCGVNTA